MIHLYLIRHGIAEEPDAVMCPDDSQRPLTAEGEHQFRRAALGIGTLIGEVDCLLTSPLLRAVQTAAILHEMAGMPRPRQEPTLAPDHTSEQILAALTACHANSIVLVGHEPELGRLLAACTTGREDGMQVRFQKGAATCVSFDTTPCAGWGQLEWLLQPRTLRRLSG